MISSWDDLRYLEALERLGSREGPVMTAGDCYRFCLSSPPVDVALTGPASTAELEENLAAHARGPLNADEAAGMRKFGHAVHG